MSIRVRRPTPHDQMKRSRVDGSISAGREPQRDPGFESAFLRRSARSEPSEVVAWDRTARSARSAPAPAPRAPFPIETPPVASSWRSARTPPSPASPALSPNPPCTNSRPRRASSQTLRDGLQSLSLCVRSSVSKFQPARRRRCRRVRPRGRSFSSTCFEGARRHQAECAASPALQRRVLGPPQARPCG